MGSLDQLLRLHRLPRPRQSRSGPIGMELAWEELRMIQLRKTRDDRVSIVARSKIPYQSTRQALFADPKQMRKLVKTALGKGHFSGRQVVTALPPDQVKIMPLAYPSNAKGDAQTILDLLAKRLEDNLDELVIDYIPVRSNPGDEERLALVVVSRRDQVTRFLDMLHEAGLEVAALDVGPAAINRVFATIPKPPRQETILVINSGREKSYLTMISGRRLLLDQQVAFGEEPLLQHLSKTLDITPELARDLLTKHGFESTPSPELEGRVFDAEEISQTLREIFKPLFLKLVEEINRILIFSASETRGNPAKQIFLLGAIAHWRGTDKLLDNLLDIPVIPITESLQSLEHPVLDEQGERLEGIQPNMVMATGLALRGMEIDA